MVLHLWMIEVNSSWNRFYFKGGQWEFFQWLNSLSIFQKSLINVPMVELKVT